MSRVIPKRRPPEQIKGRNSRLLVKGVLDGRTAHAKFLAAARAELAQHLGGNLSPTERVLVDRCAWLQLHTALYDQRVAATGKPLNEHDRRCYLAFSNSLARLCRQLGLRDNASAPADPMQALRDHLAKGEAAA